MFTILGCLLMLPFAALADWLYWLKRARTKATPRECELAISSHGAGFLALCGFILWMMGPAEIRAFVMALWASPYDWTQCVPALVFAGFCWVGAGWFFSGARRAWQFAGFRDSRCIMRALVKISLGVGVWWVFAMPPAAWSPDVRAWVAVLWLFPYTGPVVEALVIWLLVTGGTKFLLVAVPAAGNALRVVTRHRQKNNRVMVAAGGRRSRGPWPALAALALLAFGAFCFLW